MGKFNGKRKYLKKEKKTENCEVTQKERKRIEEGRRERERIEKWKT